MEKQNVECESFECLILKSIGVGKEKKYELSTYELPPCHYEGQIFSWIEQIFDPNLKRS